MKLHFLLFFVLLNLQSLSYGQGKINKAEKDLKQKKAKTKPSNSELYPNTTQNTSSYNSNGSFVTHIFSQIMAYTAYGIAIESPFEVSHKASHAFLTKYPYYNSNTGNYSYDWNTNTEIFTTSISNRFIYESNSVYGNHLNLDFRFLKRLELDIDFLQLWEKTANFGTNSLGTYTFLAKYNRVRTERFNASWGLGATYVAGDVKKMGFTYGLNAEWFFAKPFSIESNFSQAFINSESIDTFNALLNYHKKQYQFILGYEYLTIGTVTFSNATVGLGVSF